MITALITLAIVLPTILGFLFFTYLLGRHHSSNFLEKLFAGYGLGMGLTTFILFIAGVLKIKFSLIVIISAEVMLILLLIYLLVSRLKISFGEILGLKLMPVIDIIARKTSRIRFAIIAFLSGWIILKLLLLLHLSLILPVHGWDAWAQWSSGAKFFFYEKGLGLDPSSEYFFGKGYRRFTFYPLHASLLQVWFSLFIGDIHEIYMKIWSPFYFISVAGLFFIALRKETSGMISLLVTFFVVSTPLLAYHSVSSYADLPFSYYTLGAAIYFYEYIKSSESKTTTDTSKLLILMGIFLSFAFWAKIEGLFFIAAFSAALIILQIVRPLPMKNLFSYLTPLGISVIAWFMFILSNNIQIRKDEPLAISGFHLETIPVILTQMFLSANFNIIFIFFFVITIVGFKIVLRSPIKYLLASLLCTMMMFLFLYTLTDNYHYALDLSGINRNILTFLPIMYYVSALTAIKLLKVSVPKTKI